MLLDAFHGRINRKTFIIGNMVGLAVLGAAAVLFFVPIALIDLVVSSATDSSLGAGIFKIIYSLFIIPAIFWFFFFSTLFVKRVHDIGYPGMLILFAFIAVEILGRLANIPIFNLVGIILMLVVILLPGQKGRTNFGAQPPKKFYLKNIIIKF